MKTKLFLLIAVMLSALALGADVIWVVNSQSRTLSRIDLMSDNVQNAFAVLGNVPNKVVVGQDYLWVVNSGDNAIQKINKASGAHQANHLVELGSNPWDAIYHEGFLYITGLFSSKVYKMDAFSGVVHAETNVGAAPEALAIYQNKLYVSNAGNYSQNYAGSSVSVIDLESFETINQIQTGLNPQYLRIHGQNLHVSCTGNWTDSPGRIDVIDTASDEIIHSVALGGTPGNIYIDSSGIAWVADSSGMSLYAYDAEDFSVVYDAQDPFDIGASDVAGAKGMLAVLTPNWGSNASVKILCPDLTVNKVYTVGMMPTDMKLEEIATSSVVDNVASPMLELYPNPAARGEKITIKRDFGGDAKLEIYNLRGQKIDSYLLTDYQVSFDTGDYPSGIYLYRVTGSGRSKRGRFMILK